MNSIIFEERNIARKLSFNYTNFKIFKIMLKYISFFLLLTTTTVTFSQKLQETRRYNAPSTVKIDGKMLVRFHEAEEVEVVIEAEKVSLENIYTKYSGDELLIRVEPLDIEGGNVVIDVYLPSFSQLEISRGAATNLAKGILKDEAEILVKTGSTLKANIDMKSLKAKVKSGGFIELSGNLEYLEAKVVSGGKLRTDNLDLQETKLAVRSGGFAAITPKSKADLKAILGGEIKLLGSVKTKTVHTMLNGSIRVEDIDTE